MAAVGIARIPYCVCGLYGYSTPDTHSSEVALSIRSELETRAEDGGFWLRRTTISKRLRAKLKVVKDQLKRRRHLPIPEQGRRLTSMVRGHVPYDAVPGNSRAISDFRRQAGRHRLGWKRMERLLARWLPPSRD